MIKRYILTGPPGSGKTTLLEALSLKGYSCFSEASRRVIKEELIKGSTNLPWVDVESFDKLLLNERINDYNSANSGINFYDRGIIDSLAYLKVDNIVPNSDFINASTNYIYEKDVFFLPIWSKIYVNDSERSESLEKAKILDSKIKEVYESFGYNIVTLPKFSVDKRVEFIEYFLKSTY